MQIQDTVTFKARNVPFRKVCLGTPRKKGKVPFKNCSLRLAVTRGRARLGMVSFFLFFTK